ncbi:MAG: hypothetical protein CVV53_04295 [Spirochaetae bacterium HGW-Spirochaetae-9]|nr:MAG: hypothetical protein CVV53_04295 [Spirochaetae bacterium HGW-Spirochaetae-9]
MPSRLLARAKLSSASPPPQGQLGLGCEALPEIDGSLCCHPRGKLDSGRVKSLTGEIVVALGESTKILFLDFAHIDDITAAGVGFLVALQKRMRNRQGDLILYGLRPKQRRFIETLGFRDFFSIALDLRYAVEYILGIKRDIFPLSAVCPACSSPLGIGEPGRSRCRACKAVVTVLPDGSIELG